MKYFGLFLLIFAGSGCAPMQSIELTTLQQNYINRPISDIENIIGAPNSTSTIGDKKQYSWFKNQTRWVDMASGQTIAGTQYINGRNVATTIKSPPIRTMQNLSCSFDVLTNNSGKIVKLSQTSFGLNCFDIYSKL
ncbi:hypothetical protein N5853_02620 [Bartonella sp. HY329]|uniref:hypothetical protein n=1 Tax=unclassified Bartonella TaxID=2645622 RepID=UPI0021C7935E|nr:MULTISPECIES: hypothetical protein [unclassified Bartonella]UXM95546.1 hypothetical protein N5853_02620 [Bartonella sp. HY329]UXN09871.1 hypothetical protein N5852_02630 [Bartonella sp. HY328]